MQTKEKALKINLDPNIYGTFAEIGAGQEAARYFFRAGAASGTIAKTMSAYDMVVSDSIYGTDQTGRYVCESRLQRMLSREYDLLVERLAGKKEKPTSFFVFADTIATTGFKSEELGRGWIGVRFQESPSSKPSQIKLHVQLRSKQALIQQQYVGIVGVNLLYACYYLHKDPEALLKSLLDDVDSELVKINCIHTGGPLFEHIDDRLLQLQLVRLGLCDSVILGPDGLAIPPMEALYKKHVLSIKGNFKPFNLCDKDRVRAGIELLKQEEGVEPERIKVLCEVSMNGLHQAKDEEIVERFDMIATMGYSVLINSYVFPYQLVSFLQECSPKLRSLVMEQSLIQKMFAEEAKYTHLQGGFLHALGILLNGSTRIYTYPTVSDQGNLQCERIAVESHNDHLLKYFRESGYMKTVFNYDSELALITEDKVEEMVEQGDYSMLPEAVANLLKVRSHTDAN